MIEEQQTAFSSRAFVCMADLLFGLSAGVLFLNAEESQHLDDLSRLYERKQELRQKADDNLQRLGELSDQNQELDNIIKKIQGHEGHAKHQKNGK